MRSLGFILLVALCTAPAIAQRSAAPVFRTAKQTTRYARLQLLADVVVDWYCAVSEADEQQRQKLTEAINAHAVELAKQSSFRQQDYAVSSFASARPNAGRVLLEGRPWKPSPSVWEKAVQSTLNPDQHAVVVEALKRRTASQIDELVVAHVAYVEHIAGLSQNDSKVLRRHFATKYGDDLMSRALCLDNIPHLRLMGDDVVRRVLADRGVGVARVFRGQRERRGSDVSVEVRVFVGGTEEQKSDAIEEAIRSGMKQAVAIHRSTIDLAAGKHKLAKEQRHRLELAAKGVCSRHVASWRRVLADFYDQQQDWGVPIAGENGPKFITVRTRLDVPVLSKQRLWHATLERVAQSGPTAVRDKSDPVRHGMVQQLIVIFDGELWLHSTQREKLSLIHI